MKTSTIVSISVGTVVTGLVGMSTLVQARMSRLMKSAYAVYFDYRRRNDPEFRKALKRESRRQARIAKEEAEVQGKQKREEIKAAVQEAIEEGFPTDIEEKEALMSPVVRHRLPVPAPQVQTLSSPHSHMLNTIGRPVLASASRMASYRCSHGTP